MAMDEKDLLISVGGFHSAMKDPHVNAIMMELVAKMRENLETMLPAFTYKNAEERQSAIEQALIVYGWGVRDGIEEWIKHKQ